MINPYKSIILRHLKKMKNVLKISNILRELYSTDGIFSALAMTEKQKNIYSLNPNEIFV